MPKLNSNELSIDELDFVTGGGPGSLNGTGPGPSVWIRLGRDIVVAIDSVIKTIGSLIPH